MDGWDLIQRPSVRQPGASTMSAAPGSQLFLPPSPPRQISIMLSPSPMRKYLSLVGEKDTCLLLQSLKCFCINILDNKNACVKFS